jgi:hypothetical protein
MLTAIQPWCLIEDPRLNENFWKARDPPSSSYKLSKPLQTLMPVFACPDCPLVDIYFPLVPALVLDFLGARFGGSWR